MKFLLAALNAKYIHSNPALYSMRAYAAARSPAAGEQVEIAEYTINQPFFEILDDLYQRRPDAAAFSCYIWNWTLVRRLIDALHKVMPALPIWLGGPEVSFHAEAVLQKNPGVFGIMTGEGEETFWELLEWYEAPQKPLSEIAGLVFRKNKEGKIHRTKERAPLDMDELVFFYREAQADAFTNRIVYYESGRGCPFRCGYCLSSLDRTVRLRSLDRVKQELQFFLDRNTPQVKFLDRTFNCNPVHALEIWRYLLAHDNGVTNFHFEIAAELLTQEQLDLLSRMRPGQVQLEIGVQSTNPRTLQAVRRRTDPEKLARSVAQIRKSNHVHIHLDLIAGLPYEDLSRFRKSFNDVWRMRPHQLQLGFLKVLKGSYLEETAERFGIVYGDEPPYEVLFTRWLSFADIARLKRIAEMVERYHNSGQYLHMMGALERCFPTPFDLYDALADFYDKQGERGRSLSYAEGYRILLKFAVLRDPGRERLYRELTVFDLYLRENAKSRPDFLPQLCAPPKKVRAFYEREKKSPRYLSGYEGCSPQQASRMTHLEVFHWRMEADPKELLFAFDQAPEEKEYAYLFDYRRRDPLTHNARAVLLTEWGEDDERTYESDSGSVG